MTRQFVILIAILLTAGCATTTTSNAPEPIPSPPVEIAVETAPMPPPRPTAEEATRFIEEAEARLFELITAAGRAAWVQANFITEDTQQMAAAANEILTAEAVRLAKEAARFNNVELPYDVRRKLELLKTALTIPAPGDPAKNKELAQLTTKLEAMYGEGKYCPPGKSGDDCLDIQEITKIFAESRDPKKLQEVWVGWRTIAPPMRPLYTRMVELANEGSRELGFPNTGALWRSKYDMPPDQFEADVERVWTEVKPLYDSLHCYVRARLSDHYGKSIVPLDQPIRADLLGNIWAQEWSNVYDLVKPAKGGDPGYDLTKILESKKTDARGIVRYAEQFFTSLGFQPLPESFWERSLFVKPRDREVVCHASAWDLSPTDLRLKMCTEPTSEDFRTVHHELGHIFYYQAYEKHPILYRSGANDAFHEAIGDTIALSITPSYLKQLGFITKEPPASADIALLLRDALDGVAFLPWGLLVDKWRWDVFSGKISASDYNKSWWDLRTRYQGVRPPVARAEADFDPGAKYHIPANTPYMRYFLARVLQYQFHRSLCQTSGYSGPLNRCSIFGNEKAGDKLRAALALGQSRPWPDALEALTGQRQVDATAMVDYYAPLMKWLDEQNRGKKCGW
jgi:peptidyl-dipeptidase A